MKSEVSTQSAASRENLTKSRGLVPVIRNVIRRLGKSHHLMGRHFPLLGRIT